MDLKKRLKYISVFYEIAELCRKMDDIYRYSYYIDAIETLELGGTLSPKFQEKTRRIDRKGLRIRELKELNKVKPLIGVSGISLELIKKIMRSNKSITEYMKDMKLTHTQRIGIKYNNNLMKNISRKLVKFVSDNIKKCLKVNRFTITGSYRRGKIFGIKDIDILISDSKINAIDIKNKLSGEEFYSDTVVSGKTKLTFIYKMDKNPRSDDIIYPLGQSNKYDYIHVDIRVVKPKEYPYALVYFTGSREFNIIIRHKAKQKGYKLNEYGINGKQQHKNEKEIFKYLGIDMKYLDPSNRK